MDYNTQGRRPFPLKERASEAASNLFPGARQMSEHEEGLHRRYSDKRSWWAVIAIAVGAQIITGTVAAVAATLLSVNALEEKFIGMTDRINRHDSRLNRLEQLYFTPTVVPYITYDLLTTQEVNHEREVSSKTESVSSGRDG